MRKETLFAITLWSCVFVACNNIKHLPKDEILYTGASVKLDAPSSTTSRQRKTLRNDLQGLTRPKPNTKILGFRIKLAAYNFIKAKKENSFFGRLRKNFGEPPVLLSQVDLEKNEQVLQNFLENKGFFNAKVSGDTTVKRRRGKAEYNAVTGEQYKISKVEFQKDSSALASAIVNAQAKSLLKPGEPFDLDLIKGERLRIDAHLKENGFYYFSPDHLIVKVDSSIGNNMVDLYVTVKPDIPAIATEVYKINNVFIYSNYSLNTAAVDTSKADAELFRGYYIIDKEKMYKPYLFEHSMQFRPGEVYNRADHNMTLNRLINLNLFKFVKNRFEPATWLDSPKLNVYYYLTPLPKKSLQVEVTGTKKSNNFTGSELTFTWRNRNTFRGGEQLGISAYIGSEIQRSGRFQGFNTYRAGGEATISLPKFLVPFIDIRNEGAYAPRTHLKLGYDALNKRKLYTLNSFRGAYGFTWKQNIRRNNELYPISINYVQPLNITQAYKDTLLRFPLLGRATEKQFILGSSYQFTYNDLLSNAQPPKSFFLNGLIDLSGNIAGLITGANFKKGREKLIYDVPFSQYIKLEGDTRYYHKIGLNNTWANRVILGFGLPYGNSIELPFIKQFFVGGNNSLRGFRSRSVGPGRYVDTSATSRFYADQTGDIKFEVNTELRPRITGPLYGALFLDAGNVWLYNDSTWTKKPNAQFKFGKFLNELAVDAGVGLRLDITIFVIRLDVAVPLRKPGEVPPYVGNQIFKDGNYRRENIVYNLAIGYPF
ncbi:MAG: BamA/TamA family outer membrane protein [Chitinophagaceae bacterium]